MHRGSGLPDAPTPLLHLGDGLRAVPFLPFMGAKCLVCEQRGLVTPVPFDPIPAASPIDPVARNPPRIMVGTLHIVSGNPNVGPSVPLPMTRIPNVLSTRRGRHAFIPWWWRTNPNNNVGRRFGRQQ